MRRDPGSNYNIDEVYAAASVGASTVYTTAIDHKDAPSASYLISCGTFATSFAVTTQYSANNSDWTDETSGAGNDASGSLAAAGSLQIDVPNPMARYTRLKLVLGGTCVFSVTAIYGPKLYVEPADASIIS